MVTEKEFAETKVSRGKPLSNKLFADRFLVGIVLGLFLLVGIAILVAFIRPEADYRLEDAPDAAAYNYLLALGRGDYEYAYSLLSPDIPGYPTSSEEFESTVQSNTWAFHANQVLISQEIEISFTFGNLTKLDVRENLRSPRGLFNSYEYADTFEMEMRHNKTTNKWYVLKSGSYWVNCWDQVTGCP